MQDDTLQALVPARNRTPSSVGNDYAIIPSNNVVNSLSARQGTKIADDKSIIGSELMLKEQDRSFGKLFSTDKEKQTSLVLGETLGVTMTIDNWVASCLNIDGSLLQTFDTLLQLLQIQKGNGNFLLTGKVPVRTADFAKIRGLSSIASTKALIEKHIKELVGLRFDFTSKKTGKDGKPVSSFHGVVIGSYGTFRGGYFVIFEEGFREFILSRTATLALPTQALKINSNQHPCSYSICRTIYEKKKMDYWNKPTFGNVCSIKTLVDRAFSPVQIARAAEKRQEKQLLIDPIVRDLAHLKEIGCIKDYEFCDQGGRELPQDTSPVESWATFYNRVRVRVAFPENYPQPELHQVSTEKKKKVTRSTKKSA